MTRDKLTDRRDKRLTRNEKRQPTARRDRGGDVLSWDFEDSEGLSTFLTGEKAADFSAFLARVRETGRLLAGFVPPNGFRPDQPVRPLEVNSEMARDLGAVSLQDYYTLALDSEKKPQNRENGPVAEFFPHGPESIRSAIKAQDQELKLLEKSIDDLERSWPSRQGGLDATIRPIELRREKMKESRANLVRAVRLWPHIKDEAALWPNEAKRFWKKARRLEDSVNLLLKTARAIVENGENDEHPRRDSVRRSLGKLSGELSIEANAAKAILTDGSELTDNLETLVTDLDNFIAVVVGGSQVDRDWETIDRKLTKRLIEYEKEDRRLKDEAVRSSEAISITLADIIQAERRLSGQQDMEINDRLETVNRGIAALWRSVVERRREMARLYFALPLRIGRPEYLEQIFLVTALVLGRTQALLEDMRHRLSLVGSRLSTTNRLRGESESLAEKLNLMEPRAARLKMARRRLSSLSKAIEQRHSLKDIHGELTTAKQRGLDIQRSLDRGLSENDRMKKELSAATLEKDRLAEQLLFARQTMSEVGHMKARLLKVTAKKNELFMAVEQERQRLSAENDQLKADRAELARKRSRLASMYTLERQDLKKLTDELKRREDELALNQNLMAARQRERRDLEDRLTETRRERDEMDASRRELDAILAEQTQLLYSADAKTEALSAELERHRHELEKVSRLRYAWGEKTAVLRRKLDLLAQAHQSLLKTVQRQKSTLARSEAERGRLVGRLTRQKKNILRLVTVRQELRAELGATRLKLSDLEKERDGLFSQLDEANRLADMATEEKIHLIHEKESLVEEKDTLTTEKEKLAAQLAELQNQVTDDLLPFIKIMGEALWRSEGQLKRARTASTRLMESFKLESDVREANIRLQAASKEIHLTEKAWQAKKQFDGVMAEKAEELRGALERADHLEARMGEIQVARDGLARHNQQLSETVSYLGGRAVKLRQALTVLKERSDHRLEDARLNDENLRGIINDRDRAVEVQATRLAELEPFVAHFFNEAARSMPHEIDESNRELISYMKKESGALSALSDHNTDAPPVAELLQINVSLKARLDELQPLVAFLARAFVANVADLAETRQERARLADELKAADLAGGNLKENLRLQAAQLAEAQREKLQLSHELSTAATANGVLEENLESREAELAEVRDQAFSLTRERDQLLDEAAQRKDEVIVLKKELARADRELAENDGRLEASWAALNYLGTKAGDALSRMKAKMDDQVRKVDSLSLALAGRDERIKVLEDKQDKLALLYWTIVSKAAADVSRNVPAQSNAVLEVSRESTDDFNEGAVGGGAFSLGRQLLEGAKKVARHSLFTLVMAGGLIMSGSPAQAGDGAPADNFLPASSPEEPALVSRLDSTYIGRTVSLEMVTPEARLAGRAAMESQLSELVHDLAEGQGLTNGEFLSLVRNAHGLESTVHLPDFQGREGSLALLEKHFPKMAKQLATWPVDILTTHKLTSLMKSAADFKAYEGGFWERLFFDYLAVEEAAPSLDALLVHLSQKKNIAANQIRSEFAGRLAPFPELENMGPDSFITFMAGHIKNNWPNLSGRPLERAARRLAGDIYFAARMFRLPLTLLASHTHQEVETNLADFFKRGATIDILRQASTMADMAHRFGLAWQPGRPRLCDLDNLLEVSRKVTRLDPENIYKKKMALIQAYNKHISAGKDLLSGLSEDNDSLGERRAARQARRLGARPVGKFVS